MKNLSIMVLGMFCLCCLVSKAQDSTYYEFECDYLAVTNVCKAFWLGDSVLTVSGLFNEINASKNVVFRFQGNCVFLTIDGQEGIFFGNEQIGSWNTKADESERLTIQWDSLYCPNTNEVIYQFEFVPYYDEDNPYITENDTFIFHHYDDMISYYWTRSAGVIAFKGDWLFVRKDCTFLKQCILKFR